ncbi:hypothetical protein ASZ90_003394 [hydrocarbon metagenome]|uniref:Nucleotidyl transferase AbiEii/AbiGii toxin family protein n=1 Tax=hydrocarbon metagenome TaxID=938273 RepID=A0A0W8G0X0_9ZZZZ
MIPKSYITNWSRFAPWSNNHLIEQDLIIERALFNIFSDSTLHQNLAFRGGTAIHKLFFKPQPRYSEDIDLVQINPEPIGDLLTLIRKQLDFLGTANYKKTLHNNTLTFVFNTEYEPVVPAKLKIEINTREHFSVFGFKEIKREVNNQWFTENYIIRSYSLEELIATKLRALFQRRKGRDLFDIYYAANKTKLNIPNIIKAFHVYLENENLSISASEFIDNIEEKLTNELFTGDITGLIHPNIEYDHNIAWKLIKEKLIDKL